MPPAPPTDPLEATLLALEEALAPKRARRSRPLAVTGLDYTLLQVVAERGPLTLPDLFAAIQPVAGPPEVVEGLDRLGEVGWIIARPHGDRRIEAVVLTEEGEGGYRAARAWRAGVWERALEGLAPAERDGFLAGLAKVAANLAR